MQLLNKTKSITLSLGGVLLIIIFWLRYALGTAISARIDTDSAALPLSVETPAMLFTWGHLGPILPQT